MPCIDKKKKICWSYYIQSTTLFYWHFIKVFNDSKFMILGTNITNFGLLPKQKTNKNRKKEFKKWEREDHYYYNNIIHECISHFFQRKSLKDHRHNILIRSPYLDDNTCFLADLERQMYNFVKIKWTEAEVMFVFFLNLKFKAIISSLQTKLFSQVKIKTNKILALFSIENTTYSQSEICKL